MSVSSVVFVDDENNDNFRQYTPDSHDSQEADNFVEVKKLYWSTNI